MATIITLILVVAVVAIAILLMEKHYRLLEAAEKAAADKAAAEKAAADKAAADKAAAEKAAAEEQEFQDRVAFMVGTSFPMVVKYYHEGTLGQHCLFNQDMLSNEDWERVASYPHYY